MSAVARSGFNQIVVYLDYDLGVLRIELKFLLLFLRNRCARTFTPERLKLELLVGWQVNKNNSPVSSTSILRLRQIKML